MDCPECDALREKLARLEGLHVVLLKDLTSISGIMHARDYKRIKAIAEEARSGAEKVLLKLENHLQTHVTGTEPR